MKLIKYGITLQRLMESDIGLVRKWRNSPLINQYMEYREYITPKMQKKWFDSINNFNNLYYIIIYNNEKIGLANDKNVDWQARTSEAGMFLWKTKYYKTFVPILASLCGLETLFFILDWKKSFVRILKDNTKAIEYNKNLGYVLLKGQEKVNNQLYSLTKQSFEQKVKKLRKAASKICLDTTTRLLLEEKDYETNIAQHIEKIISFFPFPTKKKTDQRRNVVLLLDVNTNAVS